MHPRATLHNTNVHQRSTTRTAARSGGNCVRRGGLLACAGVAVSLFTGAADADRLIVRYKPAEQVRAEIVQEQLARGLRDANARRLTKQDLNRLCAERCARARDRVEPARIRAFDALEAVVIDVPDGRADQIAAVLEQTGDYAWVQRDIALPLAREADDPFFAQQYHHTPEHLNSVEAWLYETGDESVIVAVIDTGVDTDHPDLPSMAMGYNAISRVRQIDGGSVEDTDGHGTAVLGCAAAAGSNAIGVTGVGWGLTAMPIKVSAANGTALVSDIIDGALWAADNGARVINASFEGADLPAVGDLGTTLRDRGVLLVWSAGNSGQPRVPLDHVDTTIVAATDSNQNWAGFSAFGPGVDISAPGVDVTTLALGGGTELRTGTSFAAPLVAGSLALVWSADPTLPADTVEQVLFDNAFDLLAEGRDNRTGLGLANVGAAVAQVALTDISLSLPLVDTFVFDRLNRDVWTESSGWSIAMPDDAPSGASVLRLTSDGAHITSRELDASMSAEVNSVRVFARASSRAAGTLTLRYTDDTGAWRTLTELRSVDFERFIPHEVVLPDEARHGAMRLAVETVGAKSLTQWLVDDIRVGIDEGITLPWTETFEAEPDTVLKWDSFDAARAGAPLVPSGTTAASLTLGSSITTKPMRLGHFVNRVGFEISAAWFIRPDGAPAGSTATLEYSTDGGQTWLLLDGVTATGDNDPRFERRVVSLPFLALFNESIQLRARAAGGDWLIDDLQLTEVPPAEPRCRADVNNDGIVTNTDINMFVRSWLEGDALADVLVDGVINFDDIQTFLDWATLGCP